MICLKTRKSWAHVGAAPFVRALFLHGAAYYFALGLAFGLEIVASMINEVGRLHFQRV